MTVADVPRNGRQNTSYLTRPDGRIGYDVAGDGPLVVLVPGMGDLRAGYRFLAPALAGRRPADFGDYRDQIVASLRRPGYARAFSLTTRTSHAPARARLADVTAPVLVVMGEQDPDFPDPAAEAGWIAQATRAQAVIVPEAGHYPQSQRPDITTAAVLHFLETRDAGDRTGTNVDA